MNHNISTNMAERPQLYSLYGDKDWVTAKFYPNGMYYTYFLFALKNHKFVFCPEGNGVSCHREFEALYMGCIPILKRNRNNEYFAKLFPIYLVDNWYTVNPKDLNDFYDYYYNTGKLNEASYIQYLNFNYWKDKILNA